MSITRASIFTCERSVGVSKLSIAKFEINRKKAKIGNLLTLFVIPGRVFWPRVPPHGMSPPLQRANTAHDEILHHVPSGKPIFLQVLDSLNVRADPAKIFRSRILGKILHGDNPGEREVVFSSRLPVEPPLLPSQPRRPSKHLNILLRLTVVELQTAATSNSARNYSGQHRMDLHKSYQHRNALLILSAPT